MDRKLERAVHAKVREFQNKRQNDCATRAYDKLRRKRSTQLPFSGDSFKDSTYWDKTNYNRGKSSPSFQAAQANSAIRQQPLIST